MVAIYNLQTTIYEDDILTLDPCGANQTFGILVTLLEEIPLQRFFKSYTKSAPL